LGKSVAAQKSLEATVAEAREKRFLGRQFEACLALGEIEMNSGQTAAARARLAQLEKDAKAKGLLQGSAVGSRFAVPPG